MAEFLSESEARAITQKALSFAQADQMRVNLSSGSDGNTRFAQNQMSTSGDVQTVNLTVTSAFGRRVASSTTNRLDDDALRAVVERAEALARLAPEDPEYLGELGPQQYPESRSFYTSTADLAPEERARAIAAVTNPSAAAGLESTGFLIHNAGSTAVATSNGLFAYSTDSRANFTTTVRTSDGTGSGWAGTSVNDWGDLDTAALGRIAIEKAQDSRDPRAVEPGRWTVVLEPTAVGNMVGLMVGALGARAADEGRSFFSQPGGGNRIGQTFLDERVTIRSDPGDPAIHSAPFNNTGLPNQAETWVRNGALQNLVYDRYWAERSGRSPTGFASGWHMEGGNASIDEMIRSTERGLLVTRLWYIRGVDPRTILYTGLTRDGTFLIENGRVTYPVKNMRWNESPIFMLNNIEMMGPSVRISSGESSGLTPTVMVPALKVRDFTFTSLSDAV